MSSSVSDENLEKKFQGVTNTQDSIQTLSLWLLHHKAHHQKIVSSWMKVLKKAKINHRLTLFYLANDVVQNGKRKGFLQFGNSFAEVLREATLLVRDEQIRPSIQRVFNIWEQRNIYTPEFIADLRAILANTKVPATAQTKLIADFKPDSVIEKIRLVMKLELDAASKMSAINLSKLNATNAEIVQQLKDRTHGQQFKREFDESARLLEEIIKTSNKEIKERNDLILLLEEGEIYYDSQRGEAKIVATAYKNFSNRVKALQKKLEELKSTFPSPLPSPCPDAPSPTSSDHEHELNLPSDQAQTNEIENLENAPSPDGTPEGLNLSPSHKPEETVAQPVSTQSIGNPIPTLSNFFSNGQSGMSSWLDTFSNKKLLGATAEKSVEVSKTDSTSLDSRLSNLLQNIPNLPSGLQSTIFGNTSSGNNTPLHDSPLTVKKDTTESTTPIKDEYSGQNTPLQDEESTHSSHAFFQKITSNNKSKDILKNLTSLIQSASGEKVADDSQKKEKYSYGTESFDQGSSMPSFIKNIIPSVSQTPHSPSSFFNSTQSTLSTPVQTVPVAQTSTVTSYETAAFHDAPVYSSKPTSERSEHMSFIPTIVPSMQQDDFTYNNYSTNEYNPELETFDTDMDVENPLNDVIDENSPTRDSLSPVPSPTLDEIPRSIGGRRLSTLITVVTKDSPENSLPSREFSSDDVYKSDKENLTQEDPSWISNIPPKMGNPWNKTVLPPEPVGDQINISSPNEEFFIGKEAATLPPPFYTSVPPPPPAPLNGQNISYGEPANIPPVNTPTSLPLSKIETVQTPRNDLNERWFGNNWAEEDRRRIPQIPPLGPPPMPCNAPETRFFNKPNFHQQQFPPPRNNWVARPHRPDKMFHRPYGPPPLNKRFPFRGRGRGRHYPQY